VVVDHHASVADGVIDGGAGPEEAAVDLRDAAGADEQADIDIGELAAEPEVALALAEYLSDQRRGSALEVVAVVHKVVTVSDEARDGVVLLHELREEGALLVVADVGAECIAIDGEVFGCAFGEDLHFLSLTPVTAGGHMVSYGDSS